jgi:hypothetical protein
MTPEQQEFQSARRVVAVLFTSVAVGDGTAESVALMVAE